MGHENSVLYMTTEYYFRTISEETSLTFVTQCPPPSSISLETATTNSLTVKWEPSPVGTGANTQKFKLNIESCELGYTAEYTVTADKNTFNFSKLPDVVGTGSTLKLYPCQ